jgi:hypothetical protein
MLTLLIVILLLVLLASYAGPRYYPAYASRFRRSPLWGRRSNLLLIVLGIIAALWFLGIITADGIHSPFTTRTIRLP